MSQSIKTWTQDNFTGGENDLLPPSGIANNEVCKLTNLLVGDEAKPLLSRGGTAPLFVSNNSGNLTICSIFQFSRSVATTLGSEWVFISRLDGGVHTIDQTKPYPATDAATWKFTWTTAGYETRFTTFLNTCFAMNGVDVMRAWNGTAYNEGGDTRNTGNFTPVVDRTFGNAPRLQFAFPFRGRLWGLGSDGNVWFSGSSDTSDEILPATTPKKYYRRWENWSGTLDSDGGFENVGDDDGYRTTALGHLYNGIVVFKERCTYLWTYGDSHPLDVNTSSIEILVPAVGCVHQDTVCYQDGAMLFLGQNAAGEYNIYRLLGQGLDDISVKIPKTLKRVVANSSSSPRAIIYKHYYMIAADDADEAGNARTLVYVLDLKRKCWTEFKGWNVQCFGFLKERQTLLIGDGSTSGTILEYPAGYTDNGNPIRVEVVTRQIDGGDPLEDHRWREAFVDVESYGTTLNVATAFNGGEYVPHYVDVDIDSLDYWEDAWETFWNDGTEWFTSSVERRALVPLIERSRTLQLKVSADAPPNDCMAIKRLAVAFKMRKVRYN